MAWDNRDPKIIASVPCPVCGAAVGRPCKNLISTHMERRRAWQVHRGPRPPSAPPTLCSFCGHGSRRHAHPSGCDCECPITREELLAEAAQKA